jgi:hypothetical protein
MSREPFQKALSENVEVLYGWKDAHAVIRVRLPIPLRPWYPVQMPADTILGLKDPFDKAFAYGMLPAAERNWEKPVEFQARKDCRGRYGYADAHVELEVWYLIKWVKLEFPFEEFKLAKAAMDEAYLWAQLPAEVRDLQGVAA